MGGRFKFVVRLSTTTNRLGQGLRLHLRQMCEKPDNGAYLSNCMSRLLFDQALSDVWRDDNLNSKMQIIDTSRSCY